MSWLISNNSESRNSCKVIRTSRVRVSKQTLSKDKSLLTPSVHFSELGECEYLIMFCACSVRFEPATKLRTTNIYPYYTEEIGDDIP